MYSLHNIPDSRVVDWGVVTVADVSVAGGVVEVSAEWIKIYMTFIVN